MPFFSVSCQSSHRFPGVDAGCQIPPAAGYWPRAYSNNTTAWRSSQLNRLGGRQSPRGGGGWLPLFGPCESAPRLLTSVTDQPWCVGPGLRANPTPRLSRKGAKQNGCPRRHKLQPSIFTLPDAPWCVCGWRPTEWGACLYYLKSAQMADSCVQLSRMRNEPLVRAETTSFARKSIL